MPGRHGVPVDIKDSIDAASLPTIRLEVLVDNPDGRRRVRDMEYVGPRRTGRSVTQTGSAMTAEARRRVLPKGHALDRGSGSHAAAGTNCRQCVEHRAVGQPCQVTVANGRGCVESRFSEQSTLRVDWSAQVTANWRCCQLPTVWPR